MRFATLVLAGALGMVCIAAAARLKAPDGMAISVRGRGTDVVLVHGALGDYRQWDPIARSLGRGYRVIAVSRRFHWPTAPITSDSGYTFESQSADLEALLATLDHPVHLVGHSYGAGVALLAAMHHPERVRSLTLIEPPFGSVVEPSLPGFAAERASRDSMVSAVRAAASRGPERIAEALMDWMQGGAGGFHTLARDVQGQLVANAATAVPMFAASAPRITCEQLHDLTVPVLVLRGENTRPWFRFISEATATCLPRAESDVIPAARHMSIVENPLATARLIEVFIARHP